MSRHQKLISPRLVCGALVAVLVTGVCALVAAPAALAQVSPVVDRTSGVTADALPTEQINGVVWSQAVVGNTVYAGGSFTEARPAGSAPGTDQTPRANLLAYNLTTGNLVTSFDPSLNGEVKSVVASPDGSRIYVAGSFTTADGQQRYRLAAFDTSTGALISSFAPSLNAAANSITVTASTVYVGGIFGVANGVSRTRLAAFSASTGALLDWAPTADDVVDAVQLTPDQSHVVVAGAFTMLDGVSNPGVGAVLASTGKVTPYAVNKTVKDSSSDSAILSLSTDGKAIYGTGYTYGTGNFEGVFSVSPDTGAIRWLADCHGDSYGAYGSGKVVYVVSHEHFCANIGGFPDTNPRTRYFRTSSFTWGATGTVQKNGEPGAGYGNFAGQPSPSLRTWFPNLSAGTYTGQDQAAWSVTGSTDGKYVVEGGEFPDVNGTPQQGLVRFAIPSIAPDKSGPELYGSAVAPTAQADSDSIATVRWQANYDEDNQKLTYRLYRQGPSGTSLIDTQTVASEEWALPTMSYRDAGLKPGAQYTYYLHTSDASGNTVRSDNATLTEPKSGSSGPSDRYGKAAYTAGPTIYWRMDDTTVNAFDASGGKQFGRYVGGYRQGVSSPVAASTGHAVSFNGSTGGLYSQLQRTAPATFTEALWFRTTTKRGGSLINFGNARTGLSTMHDRAIYMLDSGRLVFGVYPGYVVRITSPDAYNDGRWHQVVASLGRGGMTLYVDGQLVASNSTSSAQTANGYWRVGGDKSWGGDSNYFAGTLDEVAVYPFAMGLTALRHVYRSSGAATNVPPTAAFTSTCSSATCTFDGSSSHDVDGTIVRSAWKFGDGATGTGLHAKHTYTKSATYSVTLTVTDDSGASTSVTHKVKVTT